MTKLAKDTYYTNAKELLQIKKRKLNFEIQKFKYANPDFVFIEHDSVAEREIVDVESEGDSIHEIPSPELLDSSIGTFDD